MEILALLKIFIEQHKKPIDKNNYSLDEVIIDMYNIENLLNMDNLFYISNNGSKKDIKINKMWLYIKYYDHLSDDKKLLKEIKKETNKIIIRFHNYLLNLKKNDQIEYDVIIL
jgi:hypothetical protein